MKINFALIFLLLASVTVIAQQKKTYLIKISTHQSQKIKGDFYRLNDSGFVVISAKNDTVLVKDAEIKKLKICEKGILVPSLITGAGTVGLMSLFAGPFADAFLIVGVPVGLTVGYVVANIVSNKKTFRNFQLLDKTMVRQQLMPYVLTQ